MTGGSRGRQTAEHVQRAVWNKGHRGQCACLIRGGWQYMSSSSPALDCANKPGKKISTQTACMTRNSRCSRAEASRADNTYSGTSHGEHKQKLSFAPCAIYSLSSHLSGILADSRQPGMMLFFNFFKSLQLSQWQESEPSVGLSRDTHTEWGKEKDLWLKCVCVVSYIID